MGEWVIYGARVYESFPVSPKRFQITTEYGYSPKLNRSEFHFYGSRSEALRVVLDALTKKRDDLIARVKEAEEALAAALLAESEPVERRPLPPEVDRE